VRASSESVGQSGEPIPVAGAGVSACHAAAMTEGRQTPRVAVEVARRSGPSLREVLAMALKERTGRLEGGADEDGAFASVFGREAQPLVVDANWFRSDVLRVCRSGGPTVLLTAAHRQLVRLYVAPHVTAEVVNHADDWTQGTQVSAEQFLSSWEQEYLPVLRVVEPPGGSLTAAEADRIEQLRQKDPDDIPTATLALLLEAPLISSDKAPTRAVYGPDANVRSQQELLELLAVAGEAGQLQEHAASATTAAVAATYGLWALGKRMFRLPAPVLLGVGALAAVALPRVPPQRREQLRRAGATVWEFVTEIAGLDAELSAQVAAARPLAPELDGDFELSVEPLLERELMWTMARQGSSQRTVAELVDDVGIRVEGCSEADVLATLQHHTPDTFSEIYDGEWQLGHCFVVPISE
jgi:predicted nucleic acid-binding protein